MDKSFRKTYCRDEFDTGPKPNALEIFCRDEYNTDETVWNPICRRDALEILFFRDEYDTDGVRLFRVRGAGDGQVDFRAEQVRALPSYYVYVLPLAASFDAFST